MPSPLEEQVENLARAIAQEQAAQMGEPPVELAEMPNDIRLDLFAQAEAAYYALLPLEVTDESVNIHIEQLWQKYAAWPGDTVPRATVTDDLAALLSAALTQNRGHPKPDFIVPVPQTEYPDHCNHEGDPVPQAVLQTEEQGEKGMSEIRKFEVDGFGDPVPNQRSGRFVLFTDHEAAMAARDREMEEAVELLADILYGGVGGDAGNRAEAFLSEKRDS